MENDMTPEQQKLFDRAIGEEKDWPNFTNDPEVNYEIDLASLDDLDEDMLPWNEASLSDKKMYDQEIKEWIKAGLSYLS